MNQDILHDIVRQKVAGMKMKEFYLQPTRIEITSIDQFIDLRNVVYLLNTSDIPVNHIITLISTDNVFEITQKEFANLRDARFQLFTDYIQIITRGEDPTLFEKKGFVPYYLEFVRIIPIKEN